MIHGQRKRFEPIALVGLFITLLLHVGSVAGILLYRRALQAAQKPPPPPSYVVAQLIRKGTPKAPKKLPDRIVPQQSTQKKQAVDYTADADARPNRPRPKRDAPLSDRQRHALDRLDLLARAQQEIDSEGEGDPNGVVGGSATGKDGDPYMTRIADLWNRTWSLPAVIPPAVAKSLYVLVVLKIDKDGQIQFPLQFDRRSGNPHFDSSIALAWQRIRKIPIPPPDRLASILANGLALKLNWRGIQ